ncbi:uncharacterized protein LOC113665599 [Pocillopora damicornis]|uniref:uncharacterized protein LOC113665599 n=1 Tax=Pocillopora damicornis TaxID=46731 RepID=UPI000F554468|nr:uncharacterized protein LOC113665599 [Pocillopora damicornis]
MLPSITNGQFRIGSSPIHGLNGVHGIRILNNSKAKDEERNCPSLPLISEGSFTSLVSRRSGKTSPNGKGSEKGNDQGLSSNGGIESGSSELKMKQLQLDCEFKNAEHGWFPQGLNPRLATSSRVSHLPAMGFHMTSTSERLIHHQSVGQPVENLHNRRQLTTDDNTNKKGYPMAPGGSTVIGTRYRMPSVGNAVSPTKDVSVALSSNLSELASPRKIHKRGVSKPKELEIHSRSCSCRRHTQERDQKATLKSRSLDSLRKERLNKVERKEGLNNKKTVKPTDRPPPKKQQMPNVLDVPQSRRKSKRANVLASDSFFNLPDYQKRVKKSTSKLTGQTNLKSLMKVKEVNRTEPVPRIDIATEEHLEESMIYVENFDEDHGNKKEKEDVVEQMDLEYSKDERELKEQSSRLDVTSAASLTVCEPQRSVTPRLLKVSSDQQKDLSTLSAIFKKLDTDCDGHLSFAELKKSLPPHVTRKQVSYLKKIYDIACESTYFGLEEFTATHQMCDLLAKSSSAVSNALNSLDYSSVDFWLSTFMESFCKVDKKQSGTIDIQSFENMLASLINVHPDSFILQRILSTVNKTKHDTISGVELLTYIPYFMTAAPKDT